MLKTIRLKIILILDICIILYFSILFLKSFLLFNNVDFTTSYWNMYDNLLEKGSPIITMINIFDNFFLVNLILAIILLIFTIFEYYNESNFKIKKLLKFFIICLSIITFIAFLFLR